MLDSLNSKLKNIDKKKSHKKIVSFDHVSPNTRQNGLNREDTSKTLRGIATPGAIETRDEFKDEIKRFSAVQSQDSDGVGGMDKVRNNLMNQTFEQRKQTGKWDIINANSVK